MKKVLSLCLALMLCVCILPVTAFATDCIFIYSTPNMAFDNVNRFYHNAVGETPATINDIAAGANATYTASGTEITLTLNGYDGGAINGNTLPYNTAVKIVFQGSNNVINSNSSNSIGISFGCPLTLELQGNAEVTGYSEEAIHTTQSLTITGSGRLEASSTNKAGIHSGHEMTIEGGTIIATGGTYGIEAKVDGGDYQQLSISGGTVTAIGDLAAVAVASVSATNVTPTGSTGTDLSATLTDVRWMESVRIYKIGTDNAKIVKFSAPVTPGPGPGPDTPPTPAPTPSYSYSAPEVTLYNNAVPGSANITLSGSGLSSGDQLITDPLTSGSNYQQMLALAGRNGAISCHNIYLKSGAKPDGAMYLHFDLDTSYAGQACTLIHKKADGSLEYFYATADYAGDLNFGPLYELSPFMLAKGTLEAKQLNPETGSNDLVGLAAAASLIALLGAACLTRKK